MAKGTTFESRLSNESTRWDTWLDPTDNIIYRTFGVKKDALSPLEGAEPLYNLNAHFTTQQLLAQGETDEGKLYDAFIDQKLAEIQKEYEHDVLQGGEQRFAALRSDKNAAVNIINVWTELQGRRDRKYAAKALAKEIPTKNLVISVDKLTKPQGMTQIDEGQLTELKSLSYSRQTFTANKYGLKFIAHEEARLKNVHNVMQDFVYVVQNKIEQRQSFDVITALSSLTAQVASGAWDTFVASTSRSTANPLTDIGIAEINIEGTAVGGEFTSIGMHQLTLQAYLANSNIRGIAPVTPVQYDFKPGTGPIAGLSQELVKDQGFQQGIVYCVDNKSEDATIHFYQGPQRLGSAHDEETGDDKYFIVDYHLAQLVQSETGFQITGCTTPLFGQVN